MKAIKYTGGTIPKKSLILTEVKQPIPKANQVLIKVKTAGINVIDIERFKNKERMSIFAKTINLIQGRNPILGGEIAGTIVGVGNAVKEFKLGDVVYGSTRGFMQYGGWAEFAICESGDVALKPDFLSYEEAAVIPLSAGTALGAIDFIKIKPKDKVLLYGASGGVGLYALQILKTKGASITAVCSERNVKNAKKYGASHIINYEIQNFDKIKSRFDKVIGINGYQKLKVIRKLLKKDGVYVAIGNTKQMVHTIFVSLYSTNMRVYSFATNKNKFMRKLHKFVSENEIRPFIDRIYSINDLDSAIEYMVNIHPQGKVVLTMNFNETVKCMNS